MKKIALALLCVFATGSAAAQTYACQFIMQAGMDKDPKTGWKTAPFKVREPFFLTMSNGFIDTASVIQPSLSMANFSITCSKHDHSSMGVSHWCADYANYLSFSEKTLNGGYSRTFGAMQSSNDSDVDTVTVSRFKCQKVR
jgi:hypothetical protein